MRSPGHGMVSWIGPPIESVRSTRFDRPGFVSPGFGRIASIQRHRPWCVSLCVAQSFIAVRRWSSNNVGPVTMSHPDSRSPCGRAPKAPSAKATVHRAKSHGCGRRRRRSTRIPHVPRCSTLRASRFLPGCGRRSPAPSVIPRSTQPSGPAPHGVAGWIQRPLPHPPSSCSRAIVAAPSTPARSPSSARTMPTSPASSGLR
jgi:hypothetical protein